MAYVITEKCLNERYGQCATVCPVNCIYPGEYQGKPFMVIDPDICITCGACLPVCPIGAIVASEEEDPEFAKVNKELAPKFKDNPLPPLRPANDPPRRSDNKLV